MWGEVRKGEGRVGCMGGVEVVSIRSITFGVK
jgi:hypothetical protein